MKPREPTEIEALEDEIDDLKKDNAWLRSRLQIFHTAPLLEPLYQLFNRLCRRELLRVSPNEAYQAHIDWLRMKQQSDAVQTRQQVISGNPPVVESHDEPVISPEPPD